jgi:hypothetical protein
MPSSSKRKGNPDTDRDGYPGPLPKGFVQKGNDEVGPKRRPMTAAEQKKLMEVLPDDIDPDELTQAEVDALLKKAK